MLRSVLQIGVYEGWTQVNAQTAIDSEVKIIQIKLLPNFSDVAL